LSDIPMNQKNGFDRTNAFCAGLVFLIAFIVYSLTVQRSFSYWDCGEFIAASVIMGVPHPPGTPFLMLLNRVFSLIPFAADISLRVNYVTVIGSSFTAMVSYLLAVRLIRYFVDDDQNLFNRLIMYVGGIIGGLFAAFGTTNWGNSVEAEAFGLALALCTVIVWLAVRFYEDRGTPQATVWLVLAMFLAMVGLGIHMTVFLVIPACATFFILKPDAGKKEYIAICAFAAVELLLVIAFANGRGGSAAYVPVSGLLGLVLLGILYRKINWGVLIAIATCSCVMIAYSLYFMLVIPALIFVLALGFLSEKYKWGFEWKTSLAIILVGILGVSCHLYSPIRSSHHPRIDENDTSRDYRTFVDFVDRKQYGQQSMVDRMFERRGAWENQFGRHANMGFWSYFEVQYSKYGGWGFMPFLALGLLGMVVAIRKRVELGLPFFTLFILCSIGLVLYMNFADGTKYSFQTGDAYLEVRNRDYFFTPAFVFFGVAMGLGAAAIMQWIKSRLEGKSIQSAVGYASLVLVLLPGISLANNYHVNDRSKNFLPYWYARNLLDSCAPNAILFTSGDNDTFPIWCLQEVYNYRRDIRVVNLSLLNTDWYVRQMKETYGVPISLTNEQIIWKPFTLANGVEASRPDKMFHDRPRQRNTYMLTTEWNGQLVRVADMITDDIVIENKFKDPIYFSAPPNGSSPLKLREKAVHAGQVYRLERSPDPRLIDVDRGFDLFMNVYRFDGYENSEVYRDENATGVGLGVVIASGRLYEELIYRGDTARAEALCRHLINDYPEYFQPYLDLADIIKARGKGDSTLPLLQQLADTLTAFLKTNTSSQYYRQDLGAAKFDIGRATNNRALIDEGIKLSWEGFEIDPNANYAFRKLVSLLGQDNRWTEVQRAARIHAQYRRNLGDDLLQRVLGVTPPQGTPLQPGPGE
jgi:hypothetical protein